MVLKQIRSEDGTGTLSYFIVDETSNISVIIDPNIEDILRIGYLIDESGTELKYVIDTHTHADHISAAGQLKESYGTKLIMHEKTKEKWKIVDEGEKFGIGQILRANAANEVDIYVNDGDIVKAGDLQFRVMSTPGHTDNHISLLLDNKLFTGDLLLIGQAGRSDLPGGSALEQYESLFNKILALPDDIEIYPGHDYEDNTFTSLGEERLNNPFLQERSKDEYIRFVKDFFPPVSENMANGKMSLQCGTKRVIKSSEPFMSIDAPKLARMLKENPGLFLLDVREPFELAAFGAIAGVVNIPMEEVSLDNGKLPMDKDSEVVVICQSGNRSYEVAYYLSKSGYSNVYNLEGGTTGWIRSNDPEVKDYVQRHRLSQKK